MANSHTCLHPQDRVIGLLGLVKTEHLENMGIYTPLDYRPIPELYTWFSRLLLADVNIDRVRWYAYFNLTTTFDPNRRHDLPSWVPDLHYIGPMPKYNLRERTSSYTGQESEHLYRASSRSWKICPERFTTGSYCCTRQAH